MTIREFKEKVYEEYGEEINKISEESKKVNEDGSTWQADVGVATDMFINKVETTDEYPKAKERVAELKAEIDG